MAKLEQLKHISVLNYNENAVCISVAPNKSIRLEPAMNDIPSLTPLTLDEIRYANNGIVFKTGALEFQEDVEDELYETLRIDKNKLMKISEIRDILLHPTKNGLQKILSINNAFDFERVRGQFQKLKCEGYSLTLDVAHIISERTVELLKGQMKTNIKIDDSDVVKQSNQVADLEKQIEEMKQMMAAMMAQNQHIAPSTSMQNDNQDTDVEKTTTKPATKTKSKTSTATK